MKWQSDNDSVGPQEIPIQFQLFYKVLNPLLILTTPFAPSGSFFTLSITYHAH